MYNALKFISSVFLLLGLAIVGTPASIVAKPKPKPMPGATRHVVWSAAVDDFNADLDKILGG